MPPIYTAIGLTRGNATNAFRERNLSNMAAATPEEVGIFSIPGPTNFHFDLLVKNIHAVGMATIAKGGTSGMYSMVNLVRRLAADPAVVPPVLEIRMGRMSEEDRATLGSFGMVESGQSKGGHWTGRPTYTQFKSILQMVSNTNNLTPVGHVNCSGYLAFQYCWRLIALFSIVMRGSKNSEHILLRLAGDAQPEKIQEKMKGYGGDEEYPVTVTGGVAVGTVVNKIPTGTTIVPLPIQTPFSNRNYTVDPSKDTLKVTGHVFPYFHNLLLPSKDYATEILFRTFSKCIADTPEELSQILPMLRRGMRNLHVTAQGMEISHIFFGIQMSVDSQASLRVVVEGKKYLGFVLVTGEPILEKAVMRTPMTPSDVENAVAHLSVQTVALRKIKKVLDGCETVAGEREEFDIEEYRASSRKLADHIYTRDLNSIDSVERDTLADALADLAYGEEFWPITPENILIVLTSMHTGRWVHPDAPFYLGRRVPMSTDSITRALAVFGPDVPSIYQGTEFKSIARPGKMDPNMEEKDGKPALRYMPWKKVSIQQGAVDWSNVRKQSRFKIFPPRKGMREFVDRTKIDGEISGPAFKGFYEQLRAFVGVPDDSGKKKNDKGRKRAMDVDEEEDSVAAKKARLTTVASFM